MRPLKDEPKALERYFTKTKNLLSCAKTHVNKLSQGGIQSKRSDDVLFLQLNRSLSQYERGNTGYLNSVDDLFAKRAVLKEDSRPGTGVLKRNPVNARSDKTHVCLKI